MRMSSSKGGMRRRKRCRMNDHHSENIVLYGLDDFEIEKSDEMSVSVMRKAERTWKISTAKWPRSAISH